MDKKSNLIPGIHNYCDRWCERCLFSSRCGVYEKTSDLPPEMLDIHNKAFWNNLVRNFQKTIDLIKEMAAARGIDLTNLSGEVEQKVQQKMGKKDFKDHPLSKLSWDYSTIAIKWLNEFPSMKENELKQSVALGMLTQKEAKHQTTFISDCLAIIEWYLYFIHAKLGRAVIGKARNDQKKAETGFQRDFDGSAKIALIAIERTIQAWYALMEFFPSKGDSFLDALSTLQKVKWLTEKEFPNAWYFVRPGFDE